MHTLNVVIQAKGCRHGGAYKYRRMSSYSIFSIVASSYYYEMIVTNAASSTPSPHLRC